VFAGFFNGFYPKYLPECPATNSVVQWPARSIGLFTCCSVSDPISRLRGPCFA